MRGAAEGRAERIPEMPKEVEESPPHRDEAFARALPLDPERTALLVVDAFVEAKELGDMLRSTP